MKIAENINLSFNFRYKTMKYYRMCIVIDRVENKVKVLTPIHSSFSNTFFQFVFWSERLHEIFFGNESRFEGKSKQG